MVPSGLNGQDADGAAFPERRFAQAILAFYSLGRPRRRSGQLGAGSGKAASGFTTTIVDVQPAGIKVAKEPRVRSRINKQGSAIRVVIR